MKKQTVYLPVKVEKDNLPTKEVCALNESNMLVGHLKYLGEGVIRPIVYVEDEHQEMGNVIHWLKPQEVFVFTTEQLNEYTANVIKQALETAAENAEIEQKGYFEATPEECLKGIEIYDDNGSDRPSFIAFLDKQSITNTFEETFKKFEV